MALAAPYVTAIKGNSLDDGPGIRTVVFFKGCPLGCAWCHNPETRSVRQELSYDMSRCVGAGECVDVCEPGALTRGATVELDRDRCTLCFACVEVCPSAALSRVGDSMSVDEIVAAVRKDLPFFKASGGGVTLSGGEPTLCLDFTTELACQLKAIGVHVLLETSGAFALEQFERLLYPHLDLIYFDLKLHDPALHRELCGADNARILRNFAALHQRHVSEGGVEVLPRVPLVPGMTAVPDNLDALAQFLVDHGVRRVALMPYNPLWGDKIGRLGGHSVHHDLPEMGRFMSGAAITECTARFTARGIEVSAA